MAYAGMSEITPKTFSDRSEVVSVISADPPTSTTAPAVIGASASKRSATSAYCADVAVACITLHLISTNASTSDAFAPLPAVQAPPAFPWIVVPSSAYDSSHTQKRSPSVAVEPSPLFTLIPEYVGIPAFEDTFLFTSMMLSSTESVAVFTIVSVPSTVRFPCTLTPSSVIVISVLPPIVVMADVELTVTFVVPDVMAVVEIAAI